MCDYSLSGIQNRLAVEGETLIVHQFHTGSKGLTSPEFLKPAPRPKRLLAVLKTVGGMTLHYRNARSAFPTAPGSHWKESPRSSGRPTIFRRLTK